MDNRHHVLQTLAPKLRELARELGRQCQEAATLDLDPQRKEHLAQLTRDLTRQADELAKERPALIVLLMGGTGVGKSTLLNALAQGKVAVASYTRPTTRDPIVYHHQSMPIERLPEPLRRCKLVAHDREALEHKILVDTPDLDSNEPENRTKLAAVLPVADVVLYVGSQEKYHDAAGWELFLQQRQRRAFAFVLNKWDRCLHGLTSGVRPDLDLIQDLQKEGFAAPLIFRTCAQSWVEANGQPQQLPEGEQFKQLESWLEHGLNRLEIQAIKAKGLVQLLHQLALELKSAQPPDIKDAAVKTVSAWQDTLATEVDRLTDRFLIKIDAHHRAIEKRFADRIHQQFRGFTAVFLQLMSKLHYFGTSSSMANLGIKLTPLAASADPTQTQPLSATSLLYKEKDWLDPQHVHTLITSLRDRLLVQADQLGIPSKFLNPRLEPLTQLMEKMSYADSFLSALDDTEKELLSSTGFRSQWRRLLIVVGDIMPPAIFVLSTGWLLYDYFLKEPRRAFYLFDLLLPFMAVLFTLIIFYFAVHWLLPMRWPAIRSQLIRRFQSKIRQDWDQALMHLPEQLAERLDRERLAWQQLEQRAIELQTWLQSQDQGANVAFLYQQ